MEHYTMFVLYNIHVVKTVLSRVNKERYDHDTTYESIYVDSYRSNVNINPYL